MDNKQIIDYIADITRHVKYYPMHFKIEKEYKAHFEDMISDRIDYGMSEDEAIQDALNSMGNAEEIGQELNAVYSPFWAWLHTITKYLFRLVFILVIFWLARPVFSWAKGQIFPNVNDMTGIHQNNITETVALNESFTVGNTVVKIKSISKTYDNLVFFSVYETKDDFRNPFYPSLMDWNVGATFRIVSNDLEHEGGSYYLRHHRYDVVFSNQTKFPDKIQIEIPHGDGSITYTIDLEGKHE